ncbi:U3 snoRNP protein, partial [Perkinsus olseni]
AVSSIVDAESAERLKAFVTFCLKSRAFILDDATPEESSNADIAEGKEDDVWAALPAVMVDPELAATVLWSFAKEASGDVLAALIEGAKTLSPTLLAPREVVAHVEEECMKPSTQGVHLLEVWVGLRLCSRRAPF